VGGASVTPDGDVFLHLAEVYSLSHASMHRGNVCSGSGPFPGGVTNGYRWYPLAGRQAAATRLCSQLQINFIRSSGTRRRAQNPADRTLALRFPAEEPERRDTNTRAENNTINNINAACSLTVLITSVA